MNYIVSDKVSLERLMMDKTIKNSFRRIKLEFANFENTKEWEDKINKNYFACGCETGSMAVCAVLVIFVVLWSIGSLFAIFTWWKMIATIFAAALTGKIAGLVLSHFQLQKLVKELEAAL
ncbi:MAG: hypothetical protein IT262_14465 [Saprospiraceae bacterium]|nr:hypothetical protein [Saprospiraceae bacterium]